ncbi:MAG: phosphoribosylformylglycinamidine cyclo-ligase [Deltaproteobacteria bacterium]|nr:phosphoribosylformylglycinamidine cyclo-ligase [Deltaproteobacteria bacterium]
MSETEKHSQNKSGLNLQDTTREAGIQSEASVPSEPSTRSWTYKAAGVDVDAGNEVVKRIKSVVRSTFSPAVITDIGGFSGLFSLESGRYKQPVLVSSCDGVGSKLKVAFETGRHDTIGIDLVAMGVNDILVQGAKPLFFMDYLAVGRVVPERAEEIIRGIANGCLQAGCALIGGETAELPDFYAADEYDLAGFVVGIADRDSIINGSAIRPGDKIIGLASSGLHSNGYTLVRRLIFGHLGLKVTDPLLSGTVADELLKPTVIYVKTVLALLEEFAILGMAHITGGGLIDNVPRVLPDGCRAVFHKDAWPRPEIFSFLQQAGNVDEREMYRTFNMGLGMILVVRPDLSEKMVTRLEAMGQPAWLVGEIEALGSSDEPVALL